MEFENDVLHDNSLRIFVAIDLPTNIKHGLKRIEQALKEKKAFMGTYPNMDTAHVTLKFLGNLDAHDLTEIDKALKKIQMPKMEAKLSRLDHFDSDEKIKVIYVGIICPALEELVKKINEAVAPWVSNSVQPYIGHITIARVNEVKDQGELVSEILNYDVDQHTFKIENFVLKQSKPTASGSEYTDLAVYPLC